MHEATLTIHKQTTPANTWVVKIPEGASKGRAIAAYGENGDQVHWDFATFASGEIVVNFGVDPIIGELEYTFHAEDSDVDTDKPSVSYDDGKIVITINNTNNGGTT